ncbi:hypothetical protein AGMMS50225_28720 [Betaproteobacteria bacterium]|nr:hypothetical protein AGMMS50225_28720 [Betaproteobacteria bacterium]
MIEESISTSGDWIGSSEVCLGLVRESHVPRIGIPKLNCEIFAEIERPLAANRGVGFANDAKLAEHFGKHGAEFPNQIPPKP